ncbi:MAG: hypothetical protein K2X93_23275 [Candidatus Obscuribacterales bacterium]|nr:hypothetical protein [Candidatus Obscuribacterales bacterium]
MNLIVPTSFDYVNNDLNLKQNGFGNSGIDRISDNSTGPIEAPPAVSRINHYPSDRTGTSESRSTENRSIDFHPTVRSSSTPSYRDTRFDVSAPPIATPIRQADNVNVMTSEKSFVEAQRLVDWQLLREIRPTIICASMQ